MAPGEPAEKAGADRASFSLLNRDVAAGVFLLVMAGIGYFGSRSLDFGSLHNVGSGLVPQSVSILLAGFGVFTIIQAFFVHEETLERFTFRGLIFVLGSVLLFAATIRTLGLVVAAPLAIIFSSGADRDTRLKEIIPFAIVLSIFCIGLFKYMLRLPIPLMPPLLGY